MVHYRITPGGEHLKEEDYVLMSDGKRRGFGLDTYHYRLVCEARERYNEEHGKPIVEELDNGFTAVTRNDHKLLPLREDFQEEWEARDGYNIEGRKFNTRHHPLHDKIFLEKKTGKRYVVDGVHKQHYFGYYYSLLIREEGTKSHGVIYWENINCREPNVLEGIEESHERFEVIDK